MDNMHNRRAHLAFVRKGASWRRMLLSQPPVTKVARVGSVRGLRRDPENKRGHLVDFPQGLRMGEFFDAVFAVNWEWDGPCPCGPDGAPVAPFGAWVAWRRTEGMVYKAYMRDSHGGMVLVGVSGLAAAAAAPDAAAADADADDPGAWLAEADLVIGEHDEDTTLYPGDLCTSHGWGNCLLRPWSKLTFLCEEYEPRGRLWLPRSAEPSDGD
jgi:hypothetical protein